MRQAGRATLLSGHAGRSVTPGADTTGNGQPEKGGKAAVSAMDTG